MSLILAVPAVRVLAVVHVVAVVPVVAAVLVVAIVAVAPLVLRTAASQRPSRSLSFLSLLYSTSIFLIF